MNVTLLDLRTSSQLPEVLYKYRGERKEKPTHFQDILGNQGHHHYYTTIICSCVALRIFFNTGYRTKCIIHALQAS